MNKKYLHIFLAFTAVNLPMLTLALEPGEKEVTTTRESGYDLGAIYDKMTVQEREIVRPQAQILPPDADLFDVISKRYQLEKARRNLE
jgi:hypothetical protein